MALIADILRNDPATLAVKLSGGVGISYGRLAEDVDCLAWWLDENGIGAGTRLAIGLTADQSYWTWILHLASMRVGSRHATVTRGSRTIQSAAELGFDVYIDLAAGEMIPGTMRSLTVPVHGLEPLTAQWQRDPRAWDRLGAEKTASRIAFTSGTTGKPRAILWDYDQICRRVEQVRKGAKITRKTRAFVAVGLMTTAGFRYPLAAWQVGGALVQRGAAAEVSRPARTIAFESNLLVASPINLRNHLQDLPEEWPGKDQRKIVILGGRLARGLRDEALRTACAEIEINYGSTETGSVAAGDASLLDRHPGAVGFARPKVSVEVVGKAGTPLPPGKIGRVRIRTPLMSAAYEGEALQQGAGQAFEDGWFYPGDLGVLFEDGLIGIEGRASETANVGGLKLAVADVEAKLMATPGVRDACVLPLTLRSGNELAIVLALRQGLKIQQFQGAVRSLLPRNCPFRMVKVPAIPRNAMGKVARRQFAQRLTSIIEQGKIKNAGRGQVQQR